MVYDSYINIEVRLMYYKEETPWNTDIAESAPSNRV